MFDWFENLRASPEELARAEQELSCKIRYDLEKNPSYWIVTGDTSLGIKTATFHNIMRKIDLIWDRPADGKEKSTFSVRKSMSDIASRAETMEISFVNEKSIVEILSRLLGKAQENSKNYKDEKRQKLAHQLLQKFS